MRKCLSSPCGWFLVLRDHPVVTRRTGKVKGLLWVDGQSVPALLAYGKRDRVQPYKASIRLDLALSEHHIPHDCLVFSHSGHGLQNDTRLYHEYPHDRGISCSLSALCTSGSFRQKNRDQWTQRLIAGEQIKCVSFGDSSLPQRRILLSFLLVFLGAFLSLWKWENSASYLQKSIHMKEFQFYNYRYI